MISKAVCLAFHWHRDRTYGPNGSCTCRTCHRAYK